MVFELIAYINYITIYIFYHILYHKFDFFRNNFIMYHVQKTIYETRYLYIK